MKLRFLLIVVVVFLLVILLAPAYGYSTQADGDVGVTVTIEASKASSTAISATYNIDVSQGGSLSYFDYVGSWWGNAFSPGESVIEWPRIGIEVTFRGYLPEDSAENEPDWGRRTYEYAYAYQYGEDFSISYKFNANHGDEIEVFVRIYDAWGVCTELREAYIIE